MIPKSNKKSRRSKFKHILTKATDPLVYFSLVLRSQFADNFRIRLQFQQILYVKHEQRWSEFFAAS